MYLKNHKMRTTHHFLPIYPYFVNMIKYLQICKNSKYNILKHNSKSFFNFVNAICSTKNNNK